MATCDSLKRSGVYAIVHRQTGKTYVGSSSNIEARWQKHASDLRRRCHKSQKLQNAWNKHGSGAFAFCVIRFCPVDDLITIEQKWINETGSARPGGYNMRPVAESNRGVVRSPETRAKISAAKRGVKSLPRSDEHRANLSAAMSGKKKSPEAVEKRAALGRGKPLSDEHRAKISSAHKGKVLPDEHRRKIADSHVGKKQSAETVAKRVATRRANRVARAAVRSS